LNQIEAHKNAKTTSGMLNVDGKGQASLQILPMNAPKNEADSQDEEAALQNTQQAFYVEFNLRQQRNFEMCRIGNQQVMQPLHLVCLSNIRVKDVRKFVFMYVRHQFKKLTKRNIELAYRKKTPLIASAGQSAGDAKQMIRSYEALSADLVHLTINDLVERGMWQKSKVDLGFKEAKGIPVNTPVYNETLYIRFVEA